MDLGLVVLVVLATARLTRVVVLDSITEGASLALVNGVRRWPRFQEWVTDLITCSWCTSFWVGPAVAVVAWQWGDHPVFIILTVGLAASWLTSIAAQWLDPGQRGFARQQ